MIHPRPQKLIISHSFEKMTISLKKFFLRFWISGSFSIAIPTLNSRKAPIAAPSVKRNSALESRVIMITLFHSAKWSQLLGRTERILQEKILSLYPLVGMILVEVIFEKLYTDLVCVLTNGVFQKPVLSTLA